MSKESIVSEQTTVFDFSGGNVCLDFVNTVNDRTSLAPEELLLSYERLVAWAQQGQLVTPAEAAQLLLYAAEHGQEAEIVLQRAIAVREAIYTIFAAIAQEDVSSASELDLLNDELAHALAHTRVLQQGHSFAWGWTFAAADLDYVFWPVLRAAADLLTSTDLHMLRLCAADDCGWLFLDTSKNQTRRWCSMRGCGNRAKARRHLARKKQQS